MAQALHPGAGQVMLLSSSRLTFLPMPPAGPFSLLEPVGSCLTSAELIRSSALSIPYQAFWGKRARGPSLCGAASECPVSLRGLPVPASSWLRLSSAGGHNGRPHASARK